MWHTAWYFFLLQFLYFTSLTPHDGRHHIGLSRIQTSNHPHASPELPPGIGTHSVRAYRWGECSTFSAAVAIHTVPIFHSTWHPLLLGGQRRCGFKDRPRLLHMTSAMGIEPKPS